MGKGLCDISCHSTKCHTTKILKFHAAEGQQTQSDQQTLLLVYRLFVESNRIQMLKLIAEDFPYIVQNNVFMNVARQ